MIYKYFTWKIVKDGIKRKTGNIGNVLEKNGKDSKQCFYKEKQGKTYMKNDLVRNIKKRERI